MKNIIVRILFSIVFIFSALHLEAAGEDDRALENAVLEAVEMYNAGKLGEAAALLERVIAANPEADAAHYYMGLIHARTGEPDAAEIELRTAAQLDTANFWYRYRLATLYSLTGKEELTLAIFEGLVEDFPKKYDLYYNMVDLYVDSGQDEKALETIDQIETVFGKNEMTALSRFDLLRKMDRTEEAYAGLEAYNAEYSSPQILSMLGDWKLSSYDEEAALKLYDEALSLAPNYAPALLGKAEVYRMTRKYDEYFALVGTFLRDQDMSVEGKSRYMDALVSSSGQNFIRIFQPQIDSLMTEFETLHPGDSTVNFTVGKYYYASGRGDMAMERFRDNVEKYPQSLSAAASYVELLMYLDRWEELSQEGRAAFSRFPSETTFMEMAGIGDYRLGHYDRVIEAYMEILDSAPQDTVTVLQAYQTIGDMQYHLGDESKAFKTYDKALKINPDYTPVLNNYAYFLSLRNKKLKKACAMSKKTVDQQPDNSTYLDTYGWILHLMGKSKEAKPIFKNAVMLYGGKESPVILDHYAEVLYALGEYDLAFLYWNQAKAKNQGDIEDLDDRIALRKAQMKQK